MPPRRKSSSTTKKTNSDVIPSKFGIQHFFERHSQSSQSQTSKTLKKPCSNSCNANNGHTFETTVAINKPNLGFQEHNIRENCSVNRGLDESVVPGAVDIEKGEASRLNLGSEEERKVEEPGSGLLDRVAGASSSGTTGLGSAAKEVGKDELNLQDGNSGTSKDLMEVRPREECDLDKLSPEMSKSFSAKRFKFSPGMLIKQSQDDGGDEITWKISPVTERLHAFSRNIPEVVKMLADSSRASASYIQHCSLNKSSPGTKKVEKQLSSPRQKTPLPYLLPSNKVGIKRVNIDQNNGPHGNADDTGNIVASRDSPFRTPPSLSYCHDKIADDVVQSGTLDELGLRQHKKALLELLDQVEDVISVEECDFNSTHGCPSKLQNGNNNETDAKSGKVIESGATGQPINNDTGIFNHSFLVLEVSDKCGSVGSHVPQRHCKVLRLLSEQAGEERTVYLWEEWFYSVVAPGDTVNVIGEFDEQGKCNVTRERNFLIVHPDILISGTRVAASFSCPRRAVLDERLKCNEQSSAALIGTLLHQIFQAGLVKDKPTKDFLEEYGRTVLKKNIENLYACGVDEYEMQKVIMEAIPKLLNWIHLFRNSKDSKAPSVDFGHDEGAKNVHISEVIDIEEMAWAPKYGLKGMIDASLRVKLGIDPNEAGEKILPLEFKTGKASSGQTSMEHCAQVILYTLLMSERYMKHVDSGLLYYLQAGHTQGISVRRSDVVGLVMRRNELASDIIKASVRQQLPPMLQSPSMCKGCRHLNVCTIYHKAHGGSTESSGLGDLFDTHVNHLTTAQCDFLRHWDRLIDLEAKETELVKRELWSSHASRSDNSASCLSSIVIEPSHSLPHEKSSNDRFIYRFVRQCHPPADARAYDGDSACSVNSKQDPECTLRIGDYVVLSTESSRIAVASGVITDINHFHVSVSFSKRLRLPGSKQSTERDSLLREVWRIDKDEAMTSFALMRFNLVQLFLQSEQSSHLRKTIVDLEAPRFDSGSIFSQDPAISYVWSQKNLNNDQRQAILKILTAKDYALILGMPGTGKTSTMVHAVKALLIRGASILLTSYTNSAVDNLLIKLKAQNIDFLRIGRHEVVHEEIRGHCFSAMELCSVEEVKMRLEQVKVVAVTCLGITNPLLTSKSFDVCIMDEAGQTTLPVSLGPLMFATKFVLVGDHYQLPPLVQSVEARENGLGVSLFCRLSEAHPQAISALQSQYRMCQGIMELSNALIYGNRLRCGSPEIANAKLRLSSSGSCSLWLKEVVNPSKPVVFVNTDMLPAHEATDQKIVNNPVEAYIVTEVLGELLSSGIMVQDIGIITPYNSQANLIRQAVHSSSVEIHTIDKYQGRDKDCILVSFVRSNKNARKCASSLLGDWHRINVALTRAKKKLIMVGSCDTLSKVPLLKLLIAKVDEQSGILSVSKKDIDQRGLKRCTNTG